MTPNAKAPGSPKTNTTIQPIRSINATRLRIVPSLKLYCDAKRIGQIGSRWIVSNTLFGCSFNTRTQQAGYRADQQIVSPTPHHNKRPRAHARRHLHLNADRFILHKDHHHMSGALDRYQPCLGPTGLIIPVLQGRFRHNEAANTNGYLAAK